ncbi:NADH-quinone oxidoreductase subunit NuoF [Acetohalobium arabaticum]|uniref:NAD(P)-dependent iron-only hydrogenase diaphorase component flavoprotein n=1 Tax=Acetohalobium arabaticum (strain ATCC 49924 / DSM 5501 / Z-7288) TaxID=574087 RepID=D9QTQ5_ACEAZ|nr:NADH-quinone oxidoreductase subunit NuoF [Acetohalobium arabaticum]ADL11819.1 NAD(P)-dependent iron-only hydrogenase diaphorase component flavoprotein [Acetohalobium arabaticum DSM 5501]
MVDSIYRSHIIICGGTGCVSSGCEEVQKALEDELDKQDLTDEINIVETGCHGLCEKGPVMVIYPEGIFYCELQPEDMEELVTEHILKDRIVDRLLYKEPITEEDIPSYQNIDFYEKQQRVVLSNCGRVDPESIKEYIAEDGYQAVGETLTTMTSQEVIDEVKEAGLRGRGGGGFPTGIKWQFAHDSEDDKKYIICNADEGDPGAFMDRSILEGDPHRVIEGMIIAAYAIGASEGYIYVRAEYPLAIERLEKAIEQAEEYGLLGDNLFESGFDFKLQIKKGAGAFVCGEETALMNSIEGKRGMPRPRPPFPAQKGLWGYPSNINNVETYANVPVIINQGADEYSKVGTEDSTGTKIFAITGKIQNTGLAEVPMGITMREIIYDVGGGIMGGKDFKAVQIGGPSGGCLPEEKLDLSVDYDSLIEAGAMMGSGGLVVMDEDTCMVDVAKFFLDFTQSESCGKCTPCREGTKRMLEILKRITAGEGKEGDIELLEELSHHIKSTSLCGLGQSAPNPVLSTIQYFRDEYEAHIYEETCPAGNCQELVAGYVIDEEDCIGCTSCVDVCPVDAIEGEKKEAHVIDTDECINCGSCVDECPVDAISQA